MTATTVSVTYNSYTIPNQEGVIQVGSSYDALTLAVDFTLSAADADALTAADATMRAALEAWNKDLEIDWGTANPNWLWHSGGHSGNTLMLGRPKVDVIGDTQGENSRRYRWSARFERPALAATYGARREGNWVLSYEASRRRRVDFTAKYTATVGSSARTNAANATTGGPPWAAAIISALTGTFDIVSENYDLEHEDKLCTFRMTYLEQLESDGSAGAVAGVINGTLDYTMDWPQNFGVSPLNFGGGGQGEKTGVAGSNSVTPPPTVTAVYRATLDTTLMTATTTAETLYRGTLKPWLLERLRDTLNLSAHPEAAGPKIPRSERWNFSRSTCTFVGTITVMIPRSANAVISYSEKYGRAKKSGMTFDKLWDGNDDTYSVWGIGGQQMATQTVAISRLNAFPDSPPLLGAPWVLDDYETPELSAEQIGKPGSDLSSGKANFAVLITMVFVRHYRYVVSGNGGRNSVVTGPQFAAGQ